MGPAMRKFTLTAHVISSVGWLGAVVAFLAVSVAGLRSTDPQVIRSSYITMELIGWFVIVPMSLASLATGLVQSLGSAWGLFRHYWVIFKLLIATLATAILFLHMQPIGEVAKVAAATNLSPGDLRDLRVQLIADAAAAVLVLIVATGLSVYKPRGLTAYGWRKQREEKRRGML
jgi:hypothetical protein